MEESTATTRLHSIGVGPTYHIEMETETYFGSYSHYVIIQAADQKAALAAAAKYGDYTVRVEIQPGLDKTPTL